MSNTSMHKHTQMQEHQCETQSLYPVIVHVPTRYDLLWVSTQWQGAGAVPVMAVGTSFRLSNQPNQMSNQPNNQISNKPNNQTNNADNIHKSTKWDQLNSGLLKLLGPNNELYKVTKLKARNNNNSVLEEESMIENMGGETNIGALAERINRNPNNRNGNDPNNRNGNDPNNRNGNAPNNTYPENEQYEERVYNELNEEKIDPIIQNQIIEEESIQRQLGENRELVTPNNVNNIKPTTSSKKCAPINTIHRYNNYGLLGSLFN